MNVIEGYIDAAKKRRFADHVADIKQYDKITVINWKNKNGSGNNYVRYILDYEDENIFVSGDLGSGVISLRELTLEKAARLVKDLPYSMKHIECATDMWYWDEDAAKKQLDSRLLDDDDVREQNEEICAAHYYDSLEAFESYLLEDCLSSFDGWSFQEAKEILDCLSELDQEYYEWIYDTGKVPNTFVVAWLVGLQMIYEQTKSSKGGAK